jgi:hypothetical protein
VKTDYEDERCMANPYVPWASEDPAWHGQSGPGIACGASESGLQLGGSAGETCDAGHLVPDQCNIDCAATGTMAHLSLSSLSRNTDANVFGFLKRSAGPSLPAVGPFLSECVEPLTALDAGATFRVVEAFDIEQCQNLGPELFLERIANVQAAKGEPKICASRIGV